MAEWPGTPDPKETKVTAGNWPGTPDNAAPQAPTRPLHAPEEKYGFTNEMVEQGFLFGFGDEITSGIDAGFDTMRELLHGEAPQTSADYTSELAHRRSLRDAWRKAHPIQATAATVLGALASGGAGAAKVAGAAPSLARAIGTGAATGAGAGGLAGFGSGEGGLQNRVQTAKQGALEGAAIGGAVPALSEMIPAAVRAGRGALGAIPAEQAAAGHVGRALERSGLTPDQVSRSLQKAHDLGVPTVAADLSQSLRRLGRTIETVPGKASEKATEFLEERQLGQAARVSGQLRGSLKNDGRAYDTAQTIMAKRSAEAKPLYEKAYAAGPVWDNRIQQFIDDPIIRQGIKKGLEVQRLEALSEGKKFDPRDYAIVDFNAAGDPIIDKVPNMRLLDAAKRGLDDILNKYRNPVTGRLELNQRGRAIDMVRRSFLQELDGLNKDYAAARASYAGHSEMLDALHKGQDLFKNDIDVVSKGFQALSPSEKDMFRVGAMKELRTSLEKAQDGADIYRRIFGTDDRRARIAMMFDDPRQFAVFSKVMQLEKETTKTTRVVRGGSPTGRIAGEQHDALEFVNDAITGKGIIPMAVKWGRRMIARASGLNEATSERIANYLFNSDPAAVKQPIDHKLIANIAKAARARKTLSGPIGAAIGQTAATQ